jgi:putative Holliday junction resolvase
MPEGRRLLLAFDFGLKRIGVATGNGLTRTATPLTTLTAAGAPPWPRIDALIAEWQPDLIVVGRPGSDAHASILAAVEGFVAQLKLRYSIDVDQVDESYTSTAAGESLRAGRSKGIYSRRLAREQIDQYAACLIAEQWMNRAVD